jgi:hypothetical protein
LESPNSVFGVRVEPEIAAATNKDRYILAVYCHKTVRPSATQAGIGIILMRSALAGKYQPTDRLGILDVIASKQFVAVPDFSEKVFASQVSFLEREIAEVRLTAA